MEMCYDGALVMPKNYAVVNEEEMTYVDGGWRFKRGWAAVGIDIVAMAICPALAPVKFMGKQAAKFLVKRYLPQLAGWAAKAARLALGVSINVVNGSIGNLLFANGWCLTSVGGMISLILDVASDGRCDGYISNGR